MAGKDEDVIAVDDVPAEKVVVEESIADTEPELFLGKYKSLEEATKGHADLEAKFGEQSNEKGTLTAENKILKSQLDQANKQSDPKQDTPTDFNAELKAIEKQVDDGDLSVGEGIRKSAAISAQIGEAKAAGSFQKQQEQAVVETSRNAFVEQNPEFTALQQSGELEAIKNELPGFHDDVSAFYVHQANKAAVANEVAVKEAAATGFEAGKAEMAKIADGATNTQKVLQTPEGDSTKNIGRKDGPYSKNELKQSGLAALQASRST